VKTARKSPKVEAPKRPSVVPLATTKRPTRDELLQSIEPPLLSLDDILIVGKHGKESERLVLTGEDLAHILSIRDQHTNTYAMCDAGDVHLMLRGLAELIQGHEDENLIEGDGAYFLARSLEALAIRLEASSRTDQFSVFLRKKSASAKAVAS
jgi:hypothetical protein